MKEVMGKKQGKDRGKENRGGKKKEVYFSKKKKGFYNTYMEHYSLSAYLKGDISISCRLRMSQTDGTLAPSLLSISSLTPVPHPSPAQVAAAAPSHTNQISPALCCLHASGLQRGSACTHCALSPRLRTWIQQKHSSLTRRMLLLTPAWTTQREIQDITFRTLFCPWQADP